MSHKIKQIVRFGSFYVFLSVILTSLTFCSSSEQLNPLPTVNQNLSTQTAVTSGNDVKLTFQLSLKVDSDDEDFDLDFTLDKQLAVDMNISDRGIITLWTKNIPPMIYRICSIDSKLNHCDVYSDATGGLDIVVVIDSCGRLIADENCGPNDQTFFSGKIKSNGSMTLSNLSIRLRLFKVDSSSDDFFEDPTESGFLDIKRFIVDLTTEDSSSGNLSVKGSPILRKDVTLVTAGVLSTTVPNLGGSDFTAVLKGTFDQDPLRFLP